MFRVWPQRPVPADDQPGRVIGQERSAKRHVGQRIQPAMRDRMVQLIRPRAQQRQQVRRDQIRQFSQDLAGLGIASKLQ